LFYRRKHYIVKNGFAETLNKLFNEVNLPNQLKHGSRLVGRWMLPHSESTKEIFAIWEYDSFERYLEIEERVRGDKEHVSRIKSWYEEHGGREHVYKEYIVKVKNEKMITTLT
jgi:hypothetical protein